MQSPFSQTSEKGDFPPRLSWCLTPASPKSAGGEAALLPRQAAVGSHHLHSVPGFDGVHQVVVQDDVHRARQLAGGGFLRHLLHSDGLVVLVAGEAKLCLQRVVLLILARTDTGNIRELKWRTVQLNLMATAAYVSQQVLVWLLKCGFFFLTIWWKISIKSFSVQIFFRKGEYFSTFGGCAS